MKYNDFTSKRTTHVIATTPYGTCYLKPTKHLSKSRIYCTKEDSRFSLMSISGPVYFMFANPKEIEDNNLPNNNY